MRGAVLILGASSPVGRGCAEAFARRGHGLVLAGRDAEELEHVAGDLRLRHGVDAGLCRFDVLGGEALEVDPDVLDGVVCVVGDMGDDPATLEGGEAARLVEANFAGPVRALSPLAAAFASRGRGFVVGVASVAGDRGRQSNFVYGSAKGGFALWLQGLRNRLHPAGVRVLTVKPGFTDTAMTWGRPGVFLAADPKRLGESIAEALEDGRDVVYLPGFWRWILLVIRSIPESVFKKLKL
ncbi:MAG: SDR family NAD(P)-dependent oxidoreductase [Holophagaceae bacterium]